MQTNFLKGKYWLQLLIFMMLGFVGLIIFQIIGVVIVMLFFDFPFSNFADPNVYKLIMQNNNGYWIFSIFIITQSIGWFLLPSLIFTKIIKQRFRDFFIFSTTKSLFYVVLLPLFVLAGVFIVNFLAEINMQLDISDFLRDKENQITENINYILSFNGLGYFLCSIILVAILPAITEELFFRGVLQKILVNWTKKKWLGIVISAFVFSAFHFQFLTFLPRFFMGIMLGYLFVWSGNILIPILAHFLHNLFSITVTVSTNSDDIRDIESGNIWVVIGSIVVMSTIGYWYSQQALKENAT